MAKELPKLTSKQEKFVLNYIINDNNASDAYRNSYNCSNMSNEAIQVEASRLKKDPKVSLWLEQADSNAKEVFNNEIKYTQKDCFLELDEMKKIALDSLDKCHNPNVNAAIKAVELKGKLTGLFVDKHEVQTQNLVDVLDQLK